MRPPEQLELYRMFKKSGKSQSCGLKGTKIEPLVPLLTFIGDIDFDKSIDNEQVIKQNEIPRSYQTSAANNK